MKREKELNHGDNELTIAIFQKERSRVIFTFNENTDSYDVEHLTLFTHGESSTTTKESKVEKLQHTMLLRSYGYNEFRNPKEVSWYATVENNTPYDEKWEMECGCLIPIESHSVGITTFHGHSCSMVDEWANETEKYILGRDNEDNNFFYGRVISEDETWKGTYEYDFDGQPTRKDVEDSYLNDISMRDIDRHEVEFGADGSRAFTNLNNEPQKIKMMIYRIVTLSTDCDGIDIFEYDAKLYNLEDIKAIFKQKLVDLTNERIDQIEQFSWWESTNTDWCNVTSSGTEIMHGCIQCTDYHLECSLHIAPKYNNSKFDKPIAKYPNNYEWDINSKISLFSDLKVNE